MGEIEQFQHERETLNELVMKYAGLGTKRFYSLDSQAYREGSLPVKTKELLGLVASFVLRCDDCIKYHVIRCHEEGVTSEELEEALFAGRPIQDFDAWKKEFKHQVRPRLFAGFRRRQRYLRATGLPSLNPAVG